MKLVTIVFENVLKDEIGRLVDEAGATGYTIVRAEGKGSRGVRAAEFEGPNFKLQTIVDDEVAELIFSKLAGDYFEDFAVIAWEAEVGVLRSKKFRAQDSED